ncbi:hypothetical protein A6C57_26745 (plasmid) [Fibrella sp. ES10-3-2-2]
MLVEEWICDRWQHTQESYEQYWEFMGRYESADRYYYKDDEPTVDSLGTNLTLNALMCVAGYLVDRCAVVVDDYEDAPLMGKWEDWLKDRLTNSGSYGWLADQRTPIPFIPESWGKLPDPWEKRNEADYLNELTPKGPKYAGGVIVWGEHGFGYSTRYDDENDRDGRARVKSVFVPAELARSFSKAFQIAKPSRFIFPAFGFEDNDKDWLAKSGTAFSVQPLFQEIKYMYEGLEENDAERRKNPGWHVAIHPTLIQYWSLKQDTNGNCYTNEQDTAIVRCEHWVDDTRADKYRRKQTYSSGSRVWINWAALQTYMAQTNQVLILDVLLQRNNSHRSRKNRYDHGKHVVFSLSPTGKLEAVGRHCPFGPADHS